MPNQLIEYMLLHRLSLIQDKDPLDKTELELVHLDGQIKATEHLLSVATDILSTNERNING